MKYPINKLEKYKGWLLDIDETDEQIVVMNRTNKIIGTISWEDICNLILSSNNIKKRKFPRVPLSIKIKYMDNEGKEYQGITDTLGGGGLFIEATSPLTIGSKLSMEFSLPDRDDEKIKAEGLVVWTRDKFERIVNFPGMGIQFTNISEDKKENLLKFVTALNKWRKPDIDEEELVES